MPKLENLINKIMEDGSLKAKQLVDDANKKAEEIIENKTMLAEKEKKKIIEKAETDSERIKEQVLVTKRLEVRDNILAAKHQAINKVLNKVVKKLNDMNKDEYFDFLYKYLKNYNLDNQEIILPSVYNEEDLNKLNDHFKENSINVSLKLHKHDRDINGGFILIGDGVESNNTFETIVENQRNELETIIIKELF